MKFKTRKGFLWNYAEKMRDDLDEFTGKNQHLINVRVSERWSQVIINIEQPTFDKHPISLEEMAMDWLPEITAPIISFEAPNQIVITKPSETFDNMLHWSNVQAWDDVEYILVHILTAPRPKNNS